MIDTVSNTMDTINRYGFTGLGAAGGAAMGLTFGFLCETSRVFSFCAQQGVGVVSKVIDRYTNSQVRPSNDIEAGVSGQGV